VIECLEVPAGPVVLGVLARVEAALEGRATLVPHGERAPRPALGDAEPNADTVLVIGTSGSTGSPKYALLTADNLRSSAEATHRILGGPGSWLLAMPAHHVAGFQVLVRSVVAGVAPVVADTGAGFTPEAFVDAAARHPRTPGLARYTALVPTQVLRLLADPAGRAALATYDAVLVGGAATPMTLRRKATEAGVTVVPTYGMSETAGGCVYAGRALEGTRVAFDGERVLLGGPTVAHGYLGRPDLSAAAFRVDADGTRWYRTDDAGHLDDRGLLHVDGRLDDLIITGGYKVAPRVVEEAVLEHVGDASDAAVVGIPDEDWGHAVALAVVGERPIGLDEVRDALRDRLPGYALPTRLVQADAIPSRGIGKPDRRALAALFTVGE
jgi:O-succinylbenzoic acid--CoA ligase